MAHNNHSISTKKGFAAENNHHKLFQENLDVPRDYTCLWVQDFCCEDKIVLKMRISDFYPSSELIFQIEFHFEVCSLERTFFKVHLEIQSDPEVLLYF